MTDDVFNYWYPLTATGADLKWAMADIEIVSGEPLAIRGKGVRGVVRHYGVEYRVESAPCGAGCHCNARVTPLDPAAVPQKPETAPNDPAVLAIADNHRARFGAFIAANPNAVKA